MEVKAQLNGIRLAPRKVRAVAKLVKGRDVKAAVDQLEYLIKKPALTLLRTINGAVANAEHNHRMVRDNLYVKDVLVNEGIKLKRYMPRAQGRATEIQKKTSRIILVLDERVAGLKQAADKRAEKKGEHVTETESQLRTTGDAKPKVERKIGGRGNFLGDLKRKMFSRKAV